MAADGNNDIQPDVSKAVSAGTDLSHGSDQAYANLMNEVNQAQQKFGKDTPQFNEFASNVADGLRKSGTLEEMSEQFAKNNMSEVAHSHDGKIRQADLNPAFGTNALESAFLGSLQHSYADGHLAARAGTTWLGNPRDAFREKDMEHILATRQHQRDVAEQARVVEDQAARQQADMARVTNNLFKNDGNPNDSLFATLDGIRTGAGKQDGKISRSDLHRFEDNYATEASLNAPGYTAENLATVRELDRNWDGPMGLALRGTSPRPGSGYPEDQEANGTINLDACSQQLGIPREQLFAAYAQPGSQSHMANVAGDSAMAPGSAPLPPVAGYGQTGSDTTLAAATSGGQLQTDANGNVIQRQGYPNSDAAVAAAPPAPSGLPQTDANGNVIGAGPLRTDANGNVIGSGTPDSRIGPPGARTPVAAPGASAYDNYYGPQGGAGRQAPGQGYAGAPEGGVSTVRHRHPSDSGAGAARRPEAAPRAGALPDIDHAPPLTMPEIKPGEDPKKVAQAYEDAAIAHFKAEAVYTVKPGQGWDRIARDTMSKSGEDASNEGKVETMSDQIAKMNGLSGRLDMSHVLQPGQQVQVRDMAWIQHQVEQTMVEFQKKVTDEAKPAGADTSAAPPTPDLYGGQRNGEGVITDPAPAAPAAGADAQAAPQAATPAAGADTHAAPQAAVTPAGTDNPQARAAAAAANPANPVTNAGDAPPGVVSPTPAGDPAALAAQADVDAARKKAAQAPTPGATTADSGATPDIYNANPLSG